MQNLDINKVDICQKEENGMEKKKESGEQNPSNSCCKLI